MEKNVKISWEGQPVEVVIGEITWKEKTDSIKKSIKEGFKDIIVLNKENLGE